MYNVLSSHDFDDWCEYKGRVMLARNLLYAYLDTQCLCAISELGVADILQNDAKPIGAIAKRVEVDADKLYRVMRYLASKGLFDELPDRHFQLNAHSQCLLSSQLGNLKDLIAFHANAPYQAALSLKQTLREDKSPFELAYSGHVFEYLKLHHDDEVHFNKAMQQNASKVSQKIVTAYDFSLYHHIVDVGGGSGSLLIAILKQNLQASGVNFDLPRLQQCSDQLIADHQLSDRCQFVGGDFLQGVPAGGDLYIMKAILHGKDDKLSVELLHQCKAQMSKQTKLLLIERVIDEQLDLLDGCINDINMLNLTRGKERTMTEYLTLIERAGLQLCQCIQVDASLCILELELA